MEIAVLGSITAPLDIFAFFASFVCIRTGVFFDLALYLNLLQSQLFFFIKSLNSITKITYILIDSISQATPSFSKTFFKAHRGQMCFHDYV